MQTIDNFEFLFYPKVVSGRCALENLPSELDSHNAQKPLMITSRAAAKGGLPRILVKAFYDSAVVIGAIYDPVLDYAGISQAREAARLFSDRGCDAIIALGGGSVMALAKAVNVLVSAKCDTLQAFYEGAAVPSVLKPLIAVATGVFDGQEAAPAMTVDHRTIVADSLCPSVFVLDGRMTGGRAQTVAESGVIALAQTVAALTTDTPNPMIDALARPALALLVRHLVPAVRHPQDKPACLALANAAVMAGAACVNSGRNLVLQLAEALGQATGIRLAKCLGLLLPVAIAELANRQRPVRDELCLAAVGLDAFAAMPAADRPSRGLEAIASLMVGLKGVLPASMQALRIQRHLLEDVAQAAAEKSAGRFTAAECRTLLSLAWDAAAR